MTLCPTFGPTQALDYELELGFVIGKNSRLGEAITIKKAEEYIFGFLLFNDWSARDIQSWEYVPLGPFLGKNFMSSVSPWIVTTEALAPYKTKGPVQDVPVLPYLQYEGDGNYDIELEIELQPEGRQADAHQSDEFQIPVLECLSAVSPSHREWMQCMRWRYHGLWNNQWACPRQCRLSA